MSLELELQRCTAALEALTAVLGKTAIFPVIDTTPAEVVPPKPQAATAPTTTPVAPSAPTTPASSTSATTPASGTPEVTPTIEYAQVAKAITDVFKVDRAKVIAALAKFDAAKGPQLKPADYAAFLKELA
jgi:BRCT domain type II-containing protein